MSPSEQMATIATISKTALIFGMPDIDTSDFIPKNDILYSPMPNPTLKPKFSPKVFKLFSIPPHIQISMIQLRLSYIPENQINPSVSRSA